MRDWQRRPNMTAIKGVIRNGEVVLRQPTNWADGTEVTIRPVGKTETPVAEDDGPMTADEIARTLAAMEKVEPFDMTGDERADLRAWEQKVKEYSIANMDKGLEDVFP